MNNYFALPKLQQRQILEQATLRIKLPVQAIEKDIWVSTILQIIFSLPVAQHLIFKGGTSLSKAWGLINRFSEDIDLAAGRALFELEGDLTKKGIKKLRKRSSIFVRDDLFIMLQDALKQYGLADKCTLTVEPDGEGDNTYPEPRKIFIAYESAYDEQLDYLRPIVMLEVGARSLVEPYEQVQVHSMVEGIFLSITTTLVNSNISTAIPAKTMVEKMFLLHELFSVPGHGTRAERKSRHLYDLYQMMQQDFAQEAITNDALWESIRHHREVFTSVQGVDYSGDVRQRICLLPREDIVAIWQSDYETMRSSMIHGSAPTWDELIEQITILQNKTRKKLEE